MISRRKIASQYSFINKLMLIVRILVKVCPMGYFSARFSNTLEVFTGNHCTDLQAKTEP